MARFRQRAPEQDEEARRASWRAWLDAAHRRFSDYEYPDHAARLADLDVPAPDGPMPLDDDYGPRLYDAPS